MTLPISSFDIGCIAQILRVSRKESANMDIKGTAIHFRLTDAEVAAVREYMRQNVATIPPEDNVQAEININEACKCLIALGLRAAQSQPKVDLKTIFQEMDPSWSGRVPHLEDPLQLSSAGAEALEKLLLEGPTR